MSGNQELKSAPVAPANADRILAHALKSGELKKGEADLKARLEKSPKDDQARFALGTLQFLRAIERMGQSWYEHGIKPENTSAPFLRLPLQKNPNPKAMTYPIFRRILDQFRHDLETTEKTLAGVKDDKVKLPIKLMTIRLDLDGDGKPTDQFSAILETVMGANPQLLKKNPEFLVKFDRGDVPWMRGYCHVLMSMLDGYLAFDTEIYFNDFVDDLFLKSKKRKLENVNRNQIIVEEPKRLKALRLHLIKVAELNRETWTHVRAETDDDFEWLPHSKQNSVLGLPVREEMVDAWLNILAELEAVLRGQKGLPIPPGMNGKLFSVKKFLDDPPEVLTDINLGEKYFDKIPTVNIEKLQNAVLLFNGPLGGAYVAWFN